jgi:penicillin-binding protein 2
MRHGVTKISRIVLVILLLAAFAFPASSPNARTTTKKKSGSVVENPATARKLRRARLHRRRRHYQHYLTSAFVSDNTAGDVYAGEDAIVRGAAIDALGNYNGTIVAINPDNGRILAMVNQKLALSEGAEPCSTIKLSVALAALSEGVVEKDTMIRLTRRSSMNLTEALAVSNNAYFENLGRRLGFRKVAHYAHQFGLGELAGWQIGGEQPGIYPKTEIPAKKGGVGRMCSFGEGISMTPLQLGALVSAIANGGTLYYLQHPATLEDAANFQPKIKRQLDIGNYIPQMTDGMAGAVDYGTARSLHENFMEEPIFGKTGTCSSKTTRFGWFGSYANTQFGKIAVVIFLQGDRKVFGPMAAEVAGRMYRNLYDHSFFAGPVSPKTTAAGAPQ